MNKAELINEIADTTGLPKKAVDDVLGALTSVITAALKNGDDVSLVGIGKFDTNEKAARTGRNPSTGEAITIAARTAPRFKAAKQLKDALN